VPGEPVHLPGWVTADGEGFGHPRISSEMQFDAQHLLLSPPSAPLMASPVVLLVT
jgi:hypothetical protein